MIIDFSNEMEELASNLKSAVGYLTCEKIIINNIRKLLFIGVTDAHIEEYLKKLEPFFENLIEENKDSKDRFNYIYAASIVNVLITTPNWRNLVRPIQK